MVAISHGPYHSKYHGPSFTVVPFYHGTPLVPFYRCTVVETYHGIVPWKKSTRVVWCGSTMHGNASTKVPQLSIEQLTTECQTATIHTSKCIIIDKH
jgi:hypothetical protein